MSADQANASSEDQKVLVGSFVFTCTDPNFKRISDKIGDVLEAQVILRGSEALGYGHVTFKKAGEAGSTEEGDIQGNATVRPPRERSNSKGRGRGRGKGRGAGRGGRARRSADDPDVLGDDVVVKTEDAAENGQLSVKAITDQVAKESSAAGTAVEGAATEAVKGGRGGKRGGRGQARAPRQKKERGEPSKTLVFVRNLPYSYDQSAIEDLLKSSSISYSSLSIPVWKFGVHKGQGRGYAFVTVSSEDEQKKTIDTLNGKEITVQITPRAPKSEEGEVKKEEGEAAEKKEKVLRLQARQGYENEQNEKENDETDGAPEGAAAEAVAA